MHVLIVGASGLIGKALAARLAAGGDAVTGTTRSGPDLSLPSVGWIDLDLRDAISQNTWTPHLQKVDAVVNCAGVLQDGPRDATSAVHATAPTALYRACERAGVRRVIQLSAIGVERETPTAFSQTKLDGDRALMASELEWVILRPSVVTGGGAYGGSALFRGLAALPVAAQVGDAGDIQIVQLEDLLATIVFFLQPHAPTRIALDVAGPDRLAFHEIVAAYRTWLGLRPARPWTVPGWLMTVAYRLGDVAGWLGWRPPIRSTAQMEMKRGAVGDAGPWTAMTGIKPRSLKDALLAEPATVQEKWFARLFLLRPVALAVFSLFWIVTAFVSLGPGWEVGRAYLREGGLTGWPADVTIISGALADLAIGLAIAWRKTTRVALIAALALTLSYVVIGTALVPALWSDPLGPMLKIWPVLALNLLLLAILDER